MIRNLNSLFHSAIANMEQYCSSKNGKKPIKRILIANNGIAAVKCIRSIRQWTYEVFSEDVIELIVMASNDDNKMNAEFIKIADQHVKVIGGGNADNYANVHLIIQIAKQYNVCAVWPGWGHASENPLLPERLEKEGILFIGPDAIAMSALGDKIGSMILAQSAGVPCIPWNGQDIKIKDISEIQGCYDQAALKSADHCQEWCDKIGYPMMIKASEGGGGKGIRKVTSSSQVHEAFYQVKAELPGSPIFAMKTATDVRHVEVQLLADSYGNAISVFSRDCSVQRRHQKIIEEAPAIIVPQETMTRMEESAVTLARMVNYRSAGTVEYLFDPKSNEFYFLELNPRLQVEHPCTEMISNLNLPACQVQVAMGIPLVNIPDIVKFFDIKSSKFDLYAKNIHPKPVCHVISARITAENPDKGFLPSSGAMRQLNFNSRNNVWGYFSVDSNGGLHEYADSQFGHVFAQGSTRDEARLNLIIALRELSIQSEFRTSVSYLIKLMERQEFVKNTYNTEWLDALLKNQNIKTFDDELSAVLYGAVYYFYLVNQRRDNSFLDDLQRGKIPNKSLFKRHGSFQCILNNIGYKIFGFQCESNKFKLQLNKSHIFMDFVELSDGGLLISDGYNSNTVNGTDFADYLEISFKNQTFTLEKNYDRSTIKCIGSGKITKWLIKQQQEVKEQDIICYVEVMKMISPVFAPTAGKLQILENEGASIITNQPIAKYLDQSQDDLVFFSGEIPKMIRPGSPNGTIINLFNDSQRQITNIMNGYYPESDIPHICHVYLSIFQRYEFPFDFVKQQLLLLEGRISCFDQVMLVLKQHEEARLDFPSAKLAQLLNNQNGQNANNSLSVFVNQFTTNICYELDCIGQLFHDFCTNNSFFNELHSNNDILDALKSNHPNDYATWQSILWKFNNAMHAKLLVNTLLDLIKKDKPISILNNHFIHEIKELAYSQLPLISIKAKELLLYCQVPTLSQKHAQLELLLNDAMTHSNPDITAIISMPCCVLPCLLSFMFNQPLLIRQLALECWIKMNHPKMVVNSHDDNKLYHQCHFQYAAVYGHLLVFHLKDLAGLEIIKTTNSNVTDLQVKYLIINTQIVKTDEQWSNILLKHLVGSIPRVICVIYVISKYPRIFTFNHKTAYVEDVNIRQVEPMLIPDLELDRFVHFNISPINLENVHQCKLFYAIAKDNNKDERIFIKQLTTNMTPYKVTDVYQYLINHGHVLINKLLDIMEIALINHPKSDNNHIFVKFMPIFVMDLEIVQQELTLFIKKYGDRLWKLKTTSAEILFQIIVNDELQHCRYHISSQDGHALFIKRINEIKPYLPLSAIESNRAITKHLNTVHVDDIPSIVQRAIGYECDYSILTLQDDKIKLTKSHDIKHGMIAYQFNYTAPEAPHGRSIVVIANNVTINHGSFSVEEDFYFLKASEYCRINKLPRIYFSCNSGARVGIVTELLPFLKVKMTNKQIDYLYLEQPNDELCSTTLMPNGDYKLNSLFGTNIGVENLSGSGLIASETVECYNETFTLSIVSCRSVGIGAYLVRLGRRIIQKKDSCILLTGKDALNKLLQKQVYNSNLQLGGPEIMYSNGTTHLVVDTDQEAFNQAIKWIQYLPLKHGELPPKLITDTRIKNNPFSTDLEASIFSVNYDGLLDRNSFMETCGGWAKTIIIGRGRLMGNSLGIITSNVISKESYIPADPANEESRESNMEQAPHVFYPNGSYKTAEAIKDFNHEGLPLLILANWRGFSGGVSDMHNMVLKFGSMIVDELQQYKQPVIIYILPNGELRGGSWVVLDSKINSEQIGLFSDVLGRGNILEPEGLTAIKLRKDKQLKMYKQMFDVNATEIPKEKSSIMLQIAEYYAGLHDTPERMKHVGVIKDIVGWEDARDYFGKYLENELLKEHYYRYYRRLYAKFDMSTTIKKSELLGKLGTMAINEKDKIEEKLHDLAKEEMMERVSYLSKALGTL